MTMSMYSSITPDEFHGGADEDVFGEYIYIIAQYSIPKTLVLTSYSLYFKSTQFSKLNATGVRENMKWQAGL